MHPIPLIDLRSSDLVSLAESHREKAINLIDASRNAFGVISRAVSHVAFPAGDYFSRRWMDRSDTPYANEIHAIAGTLGARGVYTLNLCYEWGCTSGVFASNDGVRLLRVLDWPFPALGENMVVTHQQGKAGEFYNVTWPGIAGVYTAMAPGKFSAALNQAPMRRHKTGIIIDWARNRARLNTQRALPPSHVLRQVFETANSYEQAKKMLCETPVALPVIYIVSGINAQEGCVIERLEDDYHVRELVPHDRVFAANHFESRFNGIGHGWLPRALASNQRAHCMHSLPTHAAAGNNFEWFIAPVANNLSRLACVMDANNSSLALVGTNGTTHATQRFSL